MNPGQQMVWAAAYVAAWDRQRLKAHKAGNPEGWEAVAVKVAAKSATTAVMDLYMHTENVVEHYGEQSAIARCVRAVVHAAVVEAIDGNDEEGSA